MAAAVKRTDPELQQVLDMWSAWETSGIEGFFDAVGAEVEWAASLADKVTMSTAELRDHFRRLTAAGERITARAERFEVHGDHVLVEGRLRVDAPGRMADKHIVWVYAFEDGVLKRAFSCTSRRAALEAIGE